MNHVRDWKEPVPHVKCFESAGRTDIGRHRESNEDALLVRPDVGLFVVFDGMGGHAAGEVAAALAVEAITGFFDNPDVTWPGDARGSELDPLAVLAASVKHANACIHHAATTDRRKRGMGTTVVAALARGDRLSIVHAGDSRAYLFRSGHLFRLTKDHTVGNEWIDGGMPEKLATELAVARHLTRALGPAPSVEIGVRVEVMRAGDVLLLTSDGVHGQVKDEELAGLLSEVGDLEAGVVGIVRRANENGGRDNSTAILARWS